MLIPNSNIVFNAITHCLNSYPEVDAQDAKQPFLSFQLDLLNMCCKILLTSSNINSRFQTFHSSFLGKHFYHILYADK